MNPHYIYLKNECLVPHKLSSHGCFKNTEA